MSPREAPAFDATHYKQTTRQQWDSAAQAWDRWGPFLRQWLGEATELMLGLAGIRSGSRVLDVAAGAGDQTLQAAQRVGSAGRVLATDISPRILELASANARRAGFGQIETSVQDAESLDVGEATFDAVICRLGLIYFPDRERALRAMRRALKPGGRIATIVYTTPERNGFFSIPVGVIRAHAALPPPLPGQPGPFSLGGAGVLEAELRQAGFTDITSCRLAAPVTLPSAADCVRFEQESFGALHQMMSTLADDDKVAAWQEIETRLAQFERDGRFEGPCELVIAAATRR